MEHEPCGPFLVSFFRQLNPFFESFYIQKTFFACELFYAIVHIIWKNKILFLKLCLFDEYFSKRSGSQERIVFLSRLISLGSLDMKNPDMSETDVLSSSSSCQAGKGMDRE